MSDGPVTPGDLLGYLLSSIEDGDWSHIATIDPGWIGVFAAVPWMAPGIAAAFRRCPREKREELLEWVDPDLREVMFALLPREVQVAILSS